MRRGWRAVAVAGMGAVALAGASCGPPAVATAGVSAVQAGTVAWTHGDVEGAERAPIVDVYAASHWALVRLGFPIEQESFYPNQAFLRATVGDRRVKITMDRLSDVVTRFSIKVGAWGDEPVSRLILAQLEEELKRIRGNGDDTPAP